MVELDAGEMVLKRGEQVESSIFPLDSTLITLVDRHERRALDRGRVDRKPRRGRRNRQLRPRSRFLARRSAGRRSGLQGVDGRAGGCEEPLAVHLQPVLPLFGLFARDGHAVGRVQRVPLDHRAGRALAAARAVALGRPDRANPGSACRPARSPAHDRQRGDPGAVVGRPDRDEPRNRPGDSTEPASGAARANATGGSRTIMPR